MNVSRSAYYRWLKSPESPSEKKNHEICDTIRKIHEKQPEKGYRGIRDDLEVYYGIHINDKRALRLCRKVHIQSTIKWKPKSCTRGSSNPSHIEENILNRDFHADAPNEKWLTDVTEFKWYEGIEVHKIYLSAILDLFDRRIVSFQISEHNDLPLVMNTFKMAFEAEPYAHPLSHTDRGFQYTGYQFFAMVKEHGLIHSMSRVGRCIDNGPMEGFWGILKRENYYGKRFVDRESLINMITRSINYYNTGRIQRKLHLMAPMKYHASFYEAA